VKFRHLAACAVAVLTLIGLSGCRTKVGSAAFVGGDRITDGDVGKYLTVKSTPYSNQRGNEVRPRSLVLGVLIQEQLFEKALAANGVAATDAELDKVKDDVLRGVSEEQLTSEITKSNFTGSFEPLYLRSQELFVLFGQRAGARSAEDVVAALNKVGIRVQVSPRYGTWNGSHLSLENGLDPGLSSVLTLESTAAPTPAP